MSEGFFVRDWRCPRCGGTAFSAGEARMSGGFFSSLFDVQGKKFVTAECDNCGYTEFYKRTSSTAGKILDFFTN